MAIAASLRRGETLGDRIVKVNHAGEHGAISIYRAQRFVARWRAPDIVGEIDHFLAHERRHRAIFGEILEVRGIARCRSYHFCAIGGVLLGFATGLIGRTAIAATTVAIESVVLRHLELQIAELEDRDPIAVEAISEIVAEEREHHDVSLERVGEQSWLTRSIGHLVKFSTEAVIWLGMRL